MRRLVLVLSVALAAVSLAGCGLCFKDPFHPSTSKR